MTLDDMPEIDRKAVFAALVTAQDEGVDVDISRKNVADQFKLTVDDVRVIERQGLQHEWPPL